MINKYKITESGTEFLIYGDLNVPHTALGCELIQENINLMEDEPNQHVPIMFADDLLMRTVRSRSRTRDKILGEYGIETFDDLRECDRRVRTGKSDFPKSIRDHITNKYSEIINLEWKPTEPKEEVESKEE